MPLWPLTWQDLDADGPNDFELACQNRWASERGDLEPRELADALEQCAETSSALQALDDDETCDLLRSVYSPED